MTLVIKKQYCPKRRFRLSTVRVSVPDASCQLPKFSYMQKAKFWVVSTLTFPFLLSPLLSLFLFFFLFVYCFCFARQLSFISMGNVLENFLGWYDYLEVAQECSGTRFYRNCWTSLTELWSFWHAWKDLFPLHKLDGKAFIERWIWCCSRKRCKGRGSLQVVYLGGCVMMYADYTSLMTSQLLTKS